MGQADLASDPHINAAMVCDDDVQIGGSALCDESCVIDVAEGESSCGERVHLDGSRATVDVSGLHEVELTATVCAGEGRALVIGSDAGGTVAVEGRALVVRTGEQAHEEAALFPAEGCDDWTLTVQSGRMAILQSGHRVCADTLLPFDQPWSLEMAGAERLQTVELCFRAAHPSRSTTSD